MADDFFVVGSRPSSVASTYRNYETVNTPKPYNYNQQNHINAADKLFGKLDVAKEISSRSPKKNNVNSAKSNRKGPLKATAKGHKASYVDETLFGPTLNEAEFQAPWEKEKTKKPVAFDYTDYKTKPKYVSPRPNSARKKVPTYKSKSRGSYVDESLFGSSNPHLASSYATMEVDTNKAKLHDGDLSVRSNTPNSYRPPSGRFSSLDSRPPSRTMVGEDPIAVARSPLRPDSRAGKPRVRHNPSYVDETLFGPKLKEADFPAPWEDPSEKKIRPFFFDSMNYTRTIHHENHKPLRPKSKTRPSSAKKTEPPAKPAWKWWEYKYQWGKIQYSVIFMNIDGLVQGSLNSIANALELLQSCTKPSIYSMVNIGPNPHDIVG